MFDRLFGRHTTGVTTISPREAWERTSAAPAETVLIDVREGWEFARSHARGARNIPLSQLNKRMHEIPKTTDALVICQSGHRSMVAARMLASHGYDRVVNVSGGTTVWRMSQLPME